MMHAINVENREVMADAGSIHALQLLLGQCQLAEGLGVPEARTAAVRALRNLAGSLSLRERIFGVGGTLRLIVGLLGPHASPDDQAAAAGALQKLTSYSSSKERFRKELSDVCATELLSELMFSGNDKAKQASAAALENLN
mmetsp:Transcript_27687/g.57526  ORF Transcript_27687/g.57526 Transcript_27687/m.57526 type:complete len:141 (+) Transcript_27687:134-556(+)